MVNTELLNFTRTGRGEPLFILHGLFGSGKNWQSLTRQFGTHFEVFVIDLRNHGQSFHGDEMSYEVMAEDVNRLLDHLAISCCRIIGHSMGGKIGILLALQQPKKISRLLVADIAPVAYSHAYDHLIDPMLSLMLDQFQSRAQVNNALEESIPEGTLRGFLLQNLERKDQSWRWKVNLSVVKKHMDKITGFPRLAPDWQVKIPTRFICGETSEYIGVAEKRFIAEHFSNLSFSTVANAGHWLHAEQPEQFASQALDFLLD